MSTLFHDLQERDRAHRKTLIDEYHRRRKRVDLSQAQVEALFIGWAGTIPDGTIDDLLAMAWIVVALYGDGSTPPNASDPLIVAVRDELGLPADILQWSADPENDPDAVLLTRSQRGRAAPRLLVPAERELGALLGIMLRERETDPSRGLRFEQALAKARGEFRSHEKNEAELYTNVFAHLVDEGDHSDHERVSTEHWAGIVDALVGEGIEGDDMYLQMRVRQALKGRAGDAGGGGSGSGGTPVHFPGGAKPSWIDISLPDLENQVDTEIIADNLRAMQAMYFASVLEDGKFFQVMDRVLEQFNLGVLPLGKGTAGDKLYKYYKRNFDRFTEIERRNLYARAFGTPGGEAMQENPNRQFNDLWYRFISSVSEFRRQLKVDSLLRAPTAVTLSQEQLRKSARDLGANLSLYGYGVAYFAATELQQQIRDIIDILGDEEIRSAYGARDIWQVIDQVATLDLGGARNSVRYRTMANSGAIIIRWLAENANLIGRAGRGDLFSQSDLLGSSGGTEATQPLVKPTNRDLIDACDQYLAVTGTPDTRIEEYSQPSLSPEGQTSRPIQIPNVARDLLESAGISNVSLN